MNITRKIISGILGFALLTGSVIAQEKAVVQPQQSQTKTDVSSDELKKFASIYKKVQKQNKMAQQEMAKAVKEEGLSVERYQKIAQAEKNPNADVEVTTKEEEKMSAIKSSFTEIQGKFKQKIVSTIEDGGMTTERYQLVYQQIQSDKELQSEFGKLMQG